MSEYFPPKYGSTAFNCPHCRAYAQQTWDDCLLKANEDTAKYNAGTFIPIKIGDNEVKVSLCSHCDKPTFWLVALKIPPPGVQAVAHAVGIDTRPKSVAKIMYPTTRTSPPANDDLDDSIIKIYNEAADIANRSPRASAALLRLCIEELCKQLGEKEDLNTAIGNLVKKGINRQLQQALDYCRVVGNNAVHAGKIDLEDDPSIISTLFYLVNDIAYEMITKPKEMQERYSSLPDGYKNAVAKRDGKTA